MRRYSHGQALWFGVTAVELLVLFSLFFCFFMVSFLFFRNYGIWLVIGLAFSGFTIGHLCLMSDKCVALLPLAVSVACLQWIFAPLLTYIFPPTLPVFSMSIPSHQYFSYVVPATIAMWFGMSLFFGGSILRARGEGESLRFSKNEILFLDVLIIIGILFVHFSQYLPLQGLSFLYYILALLRFTAVFMMIFGKVKGWALRAIVVYLDLFFWTSQGGVFYELVLWGGYFMIALAHLKKWKFRFLVFFLVAMLVLSVINFAKNEFRKRLEIRRLNSIQRTALLGELMAKAVIEMGQGNQTRYQSFGDQFVRYNQGWIVSRAMAYVPTFEPYAKGETVYSAVLGALVPRLAWGEKSRASSREFFSRFTGYPLPNASLALGVVGEMYVNFSRGGGILAMFIYGLFIGLVFRGFSGLAAKNSLWWALAPVVLLVCIEAEWNLSDILNHVTKALIVILILVRVVPFFRKRFLSGAGQLASYPKRVSVRS